MRLLGVWAAINALGSLAMLAWYLPWGTMLLEMLYPLAIFAVYGMTAIGCWFGAPWLSQRMFPRDGSVGLDGTWSFPAVLSAAMAIIGLWLVCMGLISLIYSVLFHGLADPMESQAWMQTTNGFAQLLIGAWLLVGMRPIVRLIVRLRTARTTADIRNNEAS